MVKPFKIEYFFEGKRDIPQCPDYSSRSTGSGKKSSNRNRVQPFMMDVFLVVLMFLRLCRTVSSCCMKSQMNNSYICSIAASSLPCFYLQQPVICCRNEE